MDSIRVSEAPDPGSIPGEATNVLYVLRLCFKKHQSQLLLQRSLPGSWKKVAPAQFRNDGINPALYSLHFNLFWSVWNRTGSNRKRKIFQICCGKKIFKKGTALVVQCPPGWRQSDGPARKDTGRAGSIPVGTTKPERTKLSSSFRFFISIKPNPLLYISLTASFGFLCYRQVLSSSKIRLGLG